VEQLTRAAEQMHLWAFMGADKLHKRAFSMEKRIEKLQTSEKPTVARKLTVKFKEREFSGDEVLVADSVSKAFGEKKLFSDLSLTVTGGERIALIGDNGTGKSTLIKMIMHDEAPDAGILYQGPAVRTGYLPQIVEFSEHVPHLSGHHAVRLPVPAPGGPGSVWPPSAFAARTCSSPCPPSPAASAAA
jgi:ATP-binding cassette subfamily F protein 3